MTANIPKTHPTLDEALENLPDVLQDVPESAGSERRVANLRLMWNGRRFVLRVAFFGFLFSVLVAFLIPQRFQSTAHLMPPDQASSGLAMLAASTGLGGGGGTGGAGGGISGQLGSGIGSLAGDLLGIKNSSELFIGVLQSRIVQDDLINKFSLKKVYSDRRMEDARDDLTRHTDLAADRKSGIISIQVADRSPSRAAAMANEYVNQLNRVIAQVNTSSAHREREFLEGRLTQVKQDLESAESNFSKFASKNTALDVPAQGKAMIEASAELEGQLIVAQSEVQGLKQLYSDGNVRVRTAEARVAELRRQLDKLGGKFDDQAPAEGQESSTMYPSIKQLPLLGIGYADLYRNTKVQEAIFETLTKEYELAKVQEAKETPSVKVLDPPDIPEKRSFPPRLVVVALGTILAIVGGVSWLFGERSWNQIEPGDPQKVFAREVIHTVRSSVPWAGRNGSRFGPE